MICDECLHKNVCKEINNFKEYNKQYEEMKKKSTLFDKPIECPCYMSKMTKGDRLDKIQEVQNQINNKVKTVCVQEKVFKLKNTVNSLMESLEGLSILYPNNLSGYKERINKSFSDIIKDINNLKIN